MTTRNTFFRAAVPTLALAALLPISTQSFATGGRWDSAVAVTGSAGTGSGATSASPWVDTPEVGSTYAEWNFFNGYPTDNTPDIAGGSASVTENTEAAFLTGGGNIYSFAAATDFTVLAGAVSGAADVWLRVGVLGVLPLTTATLNGVSARAVETYSGSSGSGFGGAEKEWLWKWSNVTAPSYTFGFGAGEPSLSLDQLGIYAAAVPVIVPSPVPEPASVLMLTAGLAAMGVVTRRRNRVRG